MTQDTGAAPKSLKDPDFDKWYVASAYQDFVRSEGVPLYEGSFLDNLITLELGDWERRGGKAAYTRLGDQEVNSLQIVEIPPGGQLKPEHHMYDAVMYVLSGRGASTLWQEGEQPHSVEWKEGSLLAIPLNAWHQEFNGSGAEPCRLMFGTNMPEMIRHFHNMDFIFNCPYVFRDRYDPSSAKFFSGEGKKWNLRMFESNFVPDIRNFELDPWPERAERTYIMRLSMAATSLGLHILDCDKGSYTTAHRHGAGAHVIQIEGEGYELLFKNGDEHNPEKRQKIPIKPGAVIAPKTGEFHQHFNLTDGRFRQHAVRGGPARYGTGESYDPRGSARADSVADLSYKLSFTKEDPNVREEYYNALASRGINLRLPPIDQ